MNSTPSLLKELDESISQGSEERRLRALWHATDVLLIGQFSEEDIWVFGEVIERLARELEVEARAELARRLAGSENAPINCVTRLASDQAIEVAGPILRKSSRLDVRTLVSIAGSASQQHLLAISKRNSVTEPVTDVLVVVGNQEVINSLVRNPGAKFSNFGFLQLIERTEHDSILVATLGHRADIPRHIFQQLIAKASDEVRKKLERERPDLVDEVDTMVAGVTGELHAIFGPASKDFFCAKKEVSTLHRQGRLREKKIFEFAQAHKVAEVTAGLSLLCALPPNIIERGLTDPTGEMPVIFAKALDFTWETTMALLFLSAPDHKILGRDLGSLEKRYSRLTVETAQSVIKLYQSRKGAGLTG